MQPRPEGLEELERLWRRTVLSPDGPCPSPETIARGAAGELPPGERTAFAAHLATCDRCADLVRLHPDVKSWADRASARLGVARPRRTFRAAWPLAAAVILGVGLLAVTRFRPTESPSYRAGGGAELRSLLEPDRPLPRAAFRLHWTPGPVGSRYSVLVATENLTPIKSAEGLTGSEFVVEERFLAGLPAGSRVVWRVRATAPGASAHSSPTYTTTVE